MGYRSHGSSFGNALKSISSSIRTRILAAFLVCIGMFTGALGYSLVQLSTMGDNLQTLTQTYQPVSEVSTHLWNLHRKTVRDHESVTKDTGLPQPANAQSSKRLSQSLRDTVSQGLRLLEESKSRDLEANDKEAIRLMEQDLNEINEARSKYDRLFDTWLTADSENRVLAFQELDTQREILGIAIGSISSRVDQRIDYLGEATSLAQERAYTLGAALSLSAILIGALLAGIALLTLKPIGKLTEQVQRLKEGDYTGRVQLKTDDEMGVLAAEINAMAEAVQHRDRILKERADALDQLYLRLRQILDTIHAGLVVMHNGQADTVNPAATQFWAIEEGDSLPTDLSVLSNGTHRSTNLGGRVFDIEIVPFGDDGQLLVGEDVTDRIAAENRLARSQRLALVGRMLAQITHEVRNPLNAMSLNTELLAEDLAGTEQQELVDTISREIKRLNQLTGRYLELSRGRRPELNLVNPIDLVRDVVNAEQQALQQSEVRAEIMGVGPGMVELDTDALRRALLNLIRNATEANASTIEIELEYETDRLILNIRDDGSGMEPEQLQQAFEPFFTTKASGTGLGLAISRQELEDVGGSLIASNHDDGGCAFRLTIPYTLA